MVSFVDLRTIQRVGIKSKKLNECISLEFETDRLEQGEVVIY